ncbi:hypothetical protein DFH09DRAFT_1215575 [Mycena vulgaris]|nr:hypothetical protein DFH09DRAFT_1215575 [Mycena vulgaris]
MGNIRIGDRRGNAEAGLIGADHMVGGGSSNSRTTRRMRMVAGRKGGSADGMMDDGRQVLARRWMGEVPMVYRSVIRVPPSDREARGTPGPVTGLYDGAGGHPSPNRSWVGECTSGRTTLDGIFAVSAMVREGVVSGMLPNDWEDRGNTGQIGLRDGVAGWFLILRIALGW